MQGVEVQVKCPRQYWCYAEVMQGSVLVSGAEVVARVKCPTRDMVEVILTNTGAGYQDITLILDNV